MNSSLLYIGQYADQRLICELRQRGYSLEISDTNAVNLPELNAEICVMDVRQCFDESWTIPLAKRLDKKMLLLVLADEEALEKPSIARLISLYAADYHTAPVDFDRLTVVLGHLMGMCRLRSVLSQGQKQGNAPAHLCVMGQMQAQLARIAPTSIPVLIRGESGVGKELVARKIHQLSDRSTGPFIAVNCGAIASGLVQSELFGHEKGAFTGAVSQRVGKIQQADGGTLFLDEIGDLPLEQQVNLLRFLQEGKFDAVGGQGSRTADVRIVAATHVDLEKALDTGEFRLDLFYRLDGVTLCVPPLRQREGDILPLAQTFIDQFSDEFGLARKILSADAESALLGHSWPGNVRELLNRIRRAVVLSDGQEIAPTDLELSWERESEVVSSLKAHKDAAERNALESALRSCRGQVEPAASQLQISRATIYRLLEKHGIAV
ncbi:sigma-54 dependent transcriptional regulator [Shewanella submarina]|uniref:Sigma 54-interacting transcriptional regulator n=1 Tax=Shewanella submarina TaxID=2016376 RepID=A0ABV7GKA9_9GAMM|nr:sigma-54 dependent transcriptional regulator [Shewanella submarina]MCL1035808.1 sigma-54 dependent transcriptional regulator [Shewanella submarina]